MLNELKKKSSVQFKKVLYEFLWILTIKFAHFLVNMPVVILGITYYNIIYSYITDRTFLCQNMQLKIQNCIRNKKKKSGHIAL